jgi:16S rRNA (cytosine1402-N4)-methyltransferase
MDNHKPVLLKEVIENLNINPDGIYIDATVGAGGHAKEILKKLSKKGQIIALDVDETAVKIANDNLGHYHNVRIYNENFINIPELLKNLGINFINGILFDLGVSNMQLSVPERGFSFQLDGNLDMRMDKNKEINAEYIINKFSYEELVSIFKNYGEERYSKRIAKKIIEKRRFQPIKTTLELANIIKSAVPYSNMKIHPATRVFQALRIYINNELENLDKVLNSIWKLLVKGGRIEVISFHSLEDRIVKQTFNKLKKENILNIITKKPIMPSEIEVRENPRSRSAKLRVAEKII